MPKKRKKPRKPVRRVPNQPGLDWQLTGLQRIWPPAAAGECSGYHVDHRDGSMSCTRGLDCAGISLVHHGWTDCPDGDACDACAGRITWICDGTTVVQ